MHADCVPGSVLCVFHVLLYLIFTATLGGRRLITISLFSVGEQERISDLPKVLLLICEGCVFQIQM